MKVIVLEDINDPLETPEEEANFLESTRDFLNDIGLRIIDIYYEAEGSSDMVIEFDDGLTEEQIINGISAYCKFTNKCNRILDKDFDENDKAKFEVLMPEDEEPIEITEEIFLRTCITYKDERGGVHPLH